MEILIDEITPYDIDTLGIEKAVIIDFGLARKEWRKNKVMLEGGAFRYKPLPSFRGKRQRFTNRACQHVKRDGKVCNKINCNSSIHMKKLKSTV